MKKKKKMEDKNGAYLLLGSNRNQKKVNIKLLNLIIKI